MVHWELGAMNKSQQLGVPVVCAVVIVLVSGACSSQSNNTPDSLASQGGGTDTRSAGSGGSTGGPGEPEAGMPDAPMPGEDTGEDHDVAVDVGASLDRVSPRPDTARTDEHDAPSNDTSDTSDGAAAGPDGGGGRDLAAGFDGNSPRSGIFAAAGTMRIDRGAHTATLLPDGRVLIVGGRNSNSTYPLLTASAELYDPAASAFTLTGAMAGVRSGHTATLLSNGKVLVAGGLDGNNKSLASAELYDPTAGTFTTTGTMTAGRTYHTATALADGKVLVVGGYDPGNMVPPTTGNAIAAAEVYDPASGTFAPAGAMTTARYAHTATLLSDGKVLVTGGLGGSQPARYLASAELFDPATGAFVPGGTMTTARANHTATLLATGKILLACGRSDVGNDLATAELYDPANRSFAATGSTVLPRGGHTATLLSNGKVLLVGGDVGATKISGADLYEPSTGTFSATGGMAIARDLHTATRLAETKVLVAGGASSPNSYLASAEIYSY